MIRPVFSTLTCTEVPTGVETSCQLQEVPQESKKFTSMFFSVPVRSFTESLKCAKLPSVSTALLTLLHTGTGTVSKDAKEKSAPSICNSDIQLLSNSFLQGLSRDTYKTRTNQFADPMSHYYMQPDSYNRATCFLQVEKVRHHRGCSGGSAALFMTESNLAKRHDPT
jgi:hypothetical protein